MQFFIFEGFPTGKTLAHTEGRTERNAFPRIVSGWIFLVQKNFFLILFREPTFIGQSCIFDYWYCYHVTALSPIIQAYKNLVLRSSRPLKTDLKEVVIF